MIERGAQHNLHVVFRYRLNKVLIIRVSKTNPRLSCSSPAHLRQESFGGCFWLRSQLGVLYFTFEPVVVTSNYNGDNLHFWLL